MMLRMIDAGITAPTTEARNPDSADLDALTPLALVTLMNTEDHAVADAVAATLPAIAEIVTVATQRLGRGGRLLYCGAGTSGRLGVLDAAECPPTFGTPPEMVQAVLAGGQGAFLKAVEHAEDRFEVGAEEMQQRGVGELDIVVGISASGRTPFVLGALEEANKRQALTGSIYCNPGSPMETAARHAVLLQVGPEILAGSTRLKAGTATKMALNMLSTGVMVLLGKTLGNLMADLTPTCEKLKIRSVRILSQSAGIDWEEAEQRLEAAGGDLRKALQA